MALPVLNVAQYDLKLPSSGKNVKYRPFLVKEEKILLMALEGGKEEDMTRAIHQIISQCLIDEINVKELPLFDIEYIFLQLRAQSIGEIVDIRFQPDCFEECEETAVVPLDLNDVKVHKPKNHKDLIDLTDSVKIKMKYPQIEASASIAGLEGEKLVEKTFEMIGQCIEYIMEGEEMHQTKDYSKKEIDEFLNSLSSGQFRSIQSFFDTMPKLKKEVTAESPSCGKKNTRTLEGIADFFVSG